MKVKDLIERLEKLPQEAIIYTDLGDDLDGPWKHSVTESTVGFTVVRVKNMKVTSRPCQETSGAEEGVIIYVLQ